VRRTICNAFGIPIPDDRDERLWITLGGGGARLRPYSVPLSNIMPMVVGKAERLTESLLPALVRAR